MNIIEPNNTFDFSKLSLGHPTNLQGGSYFTKILCEGQQLYIQAPKCTTRQGFLKTGKKINCELMFENTCEEFVQWIENLEAKCQQLLYEKSNDWFQNNLEQSDIETAFNPPIKVYKSGKYYLIRCNVKVNTMTNIPLVKIYNEHEAPVSMDEITSDSSIISILEIQGIKFTSKNFQLEIEVKQIMVLNKENIFENCLIKKVPKKEGPESLEKMYTLESSPSSEEKEQTRYTEKESDETEDSGKPENKKTEIVSKNHTSFVNDSSDEPELIDLDITLPSETESKVDEEINLEQIVNDTILEETLEKTKDGLTEFQPTLEPTSLETITLKKPNEVYYEIYKQAKEKAKAAKREAVAAYLEAKNIKKTYMLDNLDSSSDDESVDTFTDEDD
jgi:hypothetical protein